MQAAIRPDLRDYKAVLFDLDGVLTDTARVHARAWKDMFDDFLRGHYGDRGEPFQEFTYEGDYLPHVDGKPREAGVRDFLRSRSIDLPEGDEGDPASADTIHGLGTRKNERVHQLLADGVEPYPGSMRLLDQLEEAGIAMAVVSSSRNAGAVLEAAGIAGRFRTRVDGEVAAELGLPGKPAPDTYLEAARRLDAEPEHAVVVEDAISGVESGRNGGFGLVVGVDREGDADALAQHGAHVVVADLAELVR